MNNPQSTISLKEALADLRPGAHLCFLYENDVEHQTVLTPFIRLGLERGEKILYITHDQTPEMILSYLAADGLDPVPLAENGRFSIVKAEEALLKSNKFDPETAIEWFKDQMQKALDAGYSTLRIIMEASWVSQISESEAFRRFGDLLDTWVLNNKVLCLCQFDRRKIASVFLLHALTAHAVVIIGSQVFDNFYHIPPTERLGFVSEDTILDNWIQNLFKRKKAEEALESRIRFQQIITRISANFVEAGKTDVKINQALEAIGKFSGVDRAYLFQVRPDRRLIDNTHEWCAPGIEPQIAGLQGISAKEELPWFWEKMLAMETFHFPDVDDLSMEALLEQNYFKTLGIRSLVIVPVVSGGNIKGFLGFDSVQEPKFWSEDTVSLLKISGQGIGNILDRKEAEEKLHERETRYQRLTENLNIGVYRTSTLSKGQFLEANYAMARMFGYETRKEFLAVKPSDIFQDPEDLTRLIAKLTAQGQVRNEELKLIKRDKTPFVASTSIVAIKNSLGKIEYFDGVAEDITERKRIAEAIYRSEKKFRDLFNAISDLVYTQDLEGRLLSFNPSFAHILGYEPGELIGQMASDFMKPELKTLFQEEYLKQILEKGSHQGVTVFCSKSGRKVYMEYRSVLVRPEDGDPFISGIGRDVTEKILSERKIKGLQEQILQSKKMEAIGTLAGGIAHDFNNILGIILGNAELALESVQEWSPVKHHLEEVQTASLRARDVVKQLLSFSRKIEQKRKPLKLSPLIKESLKLLRASIPSNIAMTAQIEENVDPVLADPAQMHQVLINLCTNASHSMEDTGGTLTLGLGNHVVDAQMPTGSVSLTPGRYVKLRVSDTGSGIEAKYLDRIFDPYFTTKEVGKGTGLGLSVVHGIVKNHEGSIAVESTLGEGTAFSIYLPAYIGEVESVVEKKETLPTGSERILFVDDEELIVGIGCQLLERLGYRVEGRTNPMEALSLFLQDPHHFDVVITDMTMPYMNGDRLAQEILSVRPDMPVILCTGYSQKIDAFSASQIGIKYYIEKPLNRLELAKALRNVLD